MENPTRAERKGGDEKGEGKGKVTKFLQPPVRSCSFVLLPFFATAKFAAEGTSRLHHRWILRRSHLAFLLFTLSLTSFPLSLRLSSFPCRSLEPWRTLSFLQLLLLCPSLSLFALQWRQLAAAARSRTSKL